MRIHKVSSVEDFIKTVRGLREEWLRNTNLSPWFRGQENSEWGLLPKLYRYRGIDLRDEYEIREDFCTRAPALEGSVPIVEDREAANWAWYFIMQHHGAPTRLLDWTESALIALYFAVRSNDGSAPAAVWALEPWKLNQRVMGTDAIIRVPSASLREVLIFRC